MSEKSKFFEQLANIQYINYKVNGVPHKALYNEENIGEADVIKQIKEENFMHPKICFMTEAQYENVFPKFKEESNRGRRKKAK